MKTIQPNFETVKSAFYQAFVNCDKATTAIMLSGVTNGDFRSWHKKEKDFKADFNQWLDRADIRCVKQLADAVTANSSVNIPQWIRNGQFAIDYNENGALDLIRTDIED